MDVDFRQQDNAGAVLPALPEAFNPLELSARQRSKQAHPALHAAQARLITSLSAALERAPWSVCRRTGALLGLTFFQATRRRQAAIANVCRAFPDLSEVEARGIARRSAQNFGMVFCEFLHLRTASPQEIRDYSEWQGFEHIAQGFEAGRGVLLSTAHFGPWEEMGARMAQDFPLTVVVRLSSNRALREHVKAVRAAVNIKMIFKNEPGRASLKVLRADEALAIFPDQHAGPEGALLPVFGHPTRVVTSPARLALAAGAPIVPAFAIRRAPYLSDGRVIIRASAGLSLARAKGEEREASVEAGTRFVLREIENIVRQYPDQWLWMHRRWRPSDARDAACQSQSSL